MDNKKAMTGKEIIEAIRRAESKFGECVFYVESEHELREILGYEVTPPDKSILEDQRSMVVFKVF